MKRVGKWVALLILFVLIYLGWRFWAGSDDATTERKLDPATLLDRVWIDQIPEAHRDYMHAFVALSEEPVGLFQKASSYRAEAELFQFERKGNKFNLEFPQTGTKKSFSFKISTCNELPPFDLCLDVTENPWGGPKRYYSASDGRSSARDLYDDVAARVGGLAAPAPFTLAP